MNQIITLELIADFGNDMLMNEKSDATIEKYLRDIRTFNAFIGGSAVNKEAVLAYKSFLEKRYAVTSANSMLASLNSLLRYAGWQACCVRPFKLQKKTYCKEEQELSREEYLRLLKAAEKNNNRRLNLVLQTICATGIRVSELRFITVESLEHGEACVNCKAKRRTVFIVSALREKLLRYVKEQGIMAGPIFITKYGKPLNRSNIWREMKALCNEANVSASKVFPHNLRHLFARIFYGIEKDIAKLADILGHTSINTTRIYIMSTGAEHRRKMENMRLII